jgi:hypothetical protein
MGNTTYMIHHSGRERWRDIHSTALSNNIEELFDLVQGQA